MCQTVPAHGVVCCHVRVGRTLHAVVDYGVAVEALGLDEAVRTQCARAPERPVVPRVARARSDVGVTALARVVGRGAGILRPLCGASHAQISATTPSIRAPKRITWVWNAPRRRTSSAPNARCVQPDITPIKHVARGIEPFDSFQVLTLKPRLSSIGVHVRGYSRTSPRVVTLVR